MLSGSRPKRAAVSLYDEDQAMSLGKHFRKNPVIQAVFVIVERLDRRGGNAEGETGQTLTPRAGWNVNELTRL